MPTPASQCARAASDARRAAVLRACVEAPRTPEQLALERALGRPGVPWVRHAPHWLGGLRDRLKDGWDTGETRRFKRLARHLVALRPDVVDPHYGVGLWGLSNQAWAADPSDWHGYVEEEPAAVFHSLVEHLAPGYDLPRWAMDLLCFRRSAAHRVFGSLRRGGSLRPHVGTEVLPAPLTRAMCHSLLSDRGAPSLVSAVRRAQIQGLGGTPELWDRIADTALRRLASVAYEARWARVLAWVCRHEPELPVEPDELVDFLIRRRADPTGRPVVALVRELDAWHEAATPPPTTPKAQYPESGLPPASFELPDAAGTLHRWTIEELRTWSALFWEGRKMRHCVATWAPDVARGHCSVWTVRRDNRRVLTVGVRHKTAEMTEIRGRCNRSPTTAELGVLAHWARRSGLANPASA